MREKQFIGHRLQPHEARADSYRLRCFAKAIGETDPIYTDEAAARAAGHPDLPLPPTFLFCLDTEVRDDAAWLGGMGISYPDVLHAEQSFVYHRMAYANETLRFSSHITDVFSKKDGALVFVVLETQVRDMQDARVAELKTTIVESKNRTQKKDTKDATMSEKIELKAGDTLEPLQLPAVDRTTLALYAGASGDHNPIHIDIDAAHRAGLPDVFAHGMLSMAWLGRLITRWVPQQRLRQFNVRFTSVTQVGDIVVCSGQVLEEFERGGERLLRLEIRSATHNGNTTILGEALVSA